MNDPKKVFKMLIDVPNHKLAYVLKIQEYVKGMWDTAARYGIEHTKENHELLVDLVQEKLEGPNLEREWTEEEYENFVVFNDTRNQELL